MIRMTGWESGSTAVPSPGATGHRVAASSTGGAGSTRRLEDEKNRIVLDIKDSIE